MWALINQAVAAGAVKKPFLLPSNKPNTRRICAGLTATKHQEISRIHIINDRIVIMVSRGIDHGKTHRPLITAKWKALLCPDVPAEVSRVTKTVRNAGQLILRVDGRKGKTRVVFRKVAE